MQRSKYTDEQVIPIRRAQETGGTTADVCRRHGISTATLSAWTARFGGLDVSEARPQDAGGRERPAGAPAGRRPARQRWSEGSAGRKGLTPAAQRAAPAPLRTQFERSAWRACALVGADCTTVRHLSARPAETPLRAR